MLDRVQMATFNLALWYMADGFSDLPVEGGTELWTSLEDFLNGLESQGGSREIFDYVFAGGDTGANLDYFYKRYCGRRRLPDHENVCVCNHKIKENCFIEQKSTRKIFVIGNHCVRRFTGVRRTCTFCGTIHKNMKDNLCKDCRKKHIFINVAYTQKEEAKSLGACWNPTVRMWWVHPSNKNAIEKFGRFI